MADDRGQAALLALAVAVVALVAAMALGRFVQGTVDAARARTAADAAALAGVRDGPDAAARLALVNGGRLEAVRADGRFLVVRVRVGVAVATARAELAVLAPRAS